MLLFPKSGPEKNLRVNDFIKRVRNPTPTLKHVPWMQQEAACAALQTRKRMNAAVMRMRQAVAKVSKLSLLSDQMVIS